MNENQIQHVNQTLASIYLTLGEVKRELDETKQQNNHLIANQEWILQMMIPSDEALVAKVRLREASNKLREAIERHQTASEAKHQTITDETTGEEINNVVVPGEK